MRLKVYAWQSFRAECPPAPNGNRQTREIVATTSKAKAAARAQWGITVRDVEETWNAAEIERATREPGRVFWCPINDSYSDRAVWR